MRILLRLAVLGCAALACLVSPAGAIAQEAPVTTIRYGLPLPEVELLPLYAARDAGYFSAEHVAIDIYPLSSGDKIAAALFGGSIDVAYYVPDWFIRAIEKTNAKVKIVLGGANIPVYSLIVAGDVKSYEDLRGKRVAVSTIKASDAYLTRKMMAAHGLADADYSLIQAGSSGERAAALKAGAVAGTLLVPPYDQRVVDDGGVNRLDLSSAVVTHFIWGTHAVMEDWARANKPALLGFIRGWIKGTRWAADPANKEAAIAILARELKVEDRYARSAYDMYYGSGTEIVAKDGVVDLEGLRGLMASMIELGDLGPEMPDPRKYLDLSYWDEARKAMP